MTSVIESQTKPRRVSSNQHGGKDICTCSGCEDILPKILKPCLQNVAEAKIDINLDKLRNFVEVIEEGLLIRISWRKRALLKILYLRCL